MIGQVLMVMGVQLCVAAVDVLVLVSVYMLMAMDHGTMPVGMGVLVLMGMGVLQGDGISLHQYGGCQHDSQRQVELQSRPFSQAKHRAQGR